MKISGINIFSGARVALGAALTNPTSWSVQKGTLVKGYPMIFAGRRFADVETAYQALKPAAPHERDKLMAELICAKFTQYPELLKDVDVQGGREFLQACSHFTGAKSPGFQSWEGQGTESRFVRNLISGYDLAKAGEAPTEQGQFGLF